VLLECQRRFFLRDSGVVIITCWQIVALNVESKPEAAEAFAVKALPTLVFFQAGKETFRFAGATALSTLVDKLDELS